MHQSGAACVVVHVDAEEIPVPSITTTRNGETGNFSFKFQLHLSTLTARGQARRGMPDQQENPTARDLDGRV